MILRVARLQPHWGTKIAPVQVVDWFLHDHSDAEAFLRSLGVFLREFKKGSAGSLKMTALYFFSYQVQK